MGSLIKSPGGTIAPGGGYVAGRADLVAAAAARLTAPGVGLDAGCVEASTLRLQFQGAQFVQASQPGTSYHALAVSQASSQAGHDRA